MLYNVHHTTQNIMSVCLFYETDCIILLNCELLLYFPVIKRGIVPMFTVKITGFKNKACKHIEEFVFNCRRLIWAHLYNIFFFFFESQFNARVGSRVS